MSAYQIKHESGRNAVGVYTLVCNLKFVFLKEWGINSKRWQFKFKFKSQSFSNWKIRPNCSIFTTTIMVSSKACETAGKEICMYIRQFIT